MKVEICIAGETRAGETTVPIGSSSGSSGHAKPEAGTAASEATRKDANAASNTDDASDQTGDNRPTEHGGPSGPEPTRYGDWERNGRCYDF